MILSPAMKDLISLMKSTGLPYEVQEGRKHIKLYLGGKFAAVVSRGAKPEQGMRGMKNIIAAIKRVARECTLEGQAVT
jgi:nitrate reductase assembly molybdenum cofactor insertion protein NarJ